MYNPHILPLIFMQFYTVCPTWEFSDDTQPLHTFILQPSWAEVDKLIIDTKFPCLLGLTVLLDIHIIVTGEQHVKTA